MHKRFALQFQFDPDGEPETNFVVAFVEDGHMMQEVEDLDEQKQWAASFDMTETDCSEGVVGSLAYNMVFCIP